ncbi:MAG: hypothetical protein AAGD05_07415, partial [Bacteroidota bacterium]
MKGRNEKIDQIFRDRLNDYASSSPEHLWEKIDAQRSKRKKRPFFYRWRFSILALALLITSMGLYWMIAGQHNERLLNALILAKSENQSLVPPTIGEKENVELSTTTTTKEASTNEEKQFAPNETTTSTTNSGSTEAALTNASAVTTTAVATPSTRQKALKPSSGSLTKTAQSIATPPETSTGQNIALSEPWSDKGQANEWAPSTSEESLPDRSTSPAVGSATTNLLDSKTTNLKSLQALYLPQQGALSEIDRAPDESLLEFKPRGCYSFKGRKTNFNLFVDVFYSQERAIRSLSTKDSEYDNYMELRDSTGLERWIV